MKTGHSLLKHVGKVISAIVTASTTLLTGIAHACWRDDGVTAMAQSVANQGFPNAANRMPAILVCDGSVFGPGIGGDYGVGRHTIRIPQWQLNRPDLNSVLAHELAHAEVWLTGGGTENNGHSADFMRALLRAGWGGEAQRVAQYLPGAQYALDQARADTAPDDGDSTRPPRYAPPNISPPAYGPPNTLVEVCRDEHSLSYRQIRPGVFQGVITTRRTCRLVPAR